MTGSIGGITRRKINTAAVLIGAGAASGSLLLQVMEMYSKGEPERKLARMRRDRLMELFLPPDEFGVVPASNHPTISVPSGKGTYVSVERGIGAIRGLYGSAVETVKGMIPVSDSRSLVVIGAPNSNTTAEKVLGRETAPQFSWNFKDRTVELAYSITTLGGFVTRMRDGKPHRADHRGICAPGRLIAAPKPVGAALLRRDYLLVTRVPLGERTLVSYAGMHGPATRSLHHLFYEMDDKQLDELCNRVDLADYFQAIFEVEVAEEDGTSIPVALKLMRNSVRTFTPKLLKGTRRATRST